MTTDHPLPTVQRVDAGLAEMLIDSRERAVTVTISGELDVSNVATVQAAIVAAMRGGARVLAIDFSAVTYIDSSTIAMVLMLASEMTMKRGRLALVAPPDGQVRRVLHYAGVTEQLDLHDSLDAAGVAAPVADTHASS